MTTTSIFADSNRARMRYIRATDGWGTTPTSGKTREIRFTGSTLNATKQTAVSEEVRADRMIPGVIEVGAKSAGQINVEFSAGSHDDFLEGFMFGAWTRPMTYDAVLGDVLQWEANNTLYVLGVDVSDYFIVGRRVRTDGFSTPANNDYWQLLTVTWNSGSNRTELVMTTATAVAEVGNDLSLLEDANDVILLKNTTVRFGTAAASTIDSNGGNAFAAAIAAGQLTPGQKVYVETAVGMETGTMTFTKQPAAGDKVTVSDGKNIVTFQFGGVDSNTVTLVDLGADQAGFEANFEAALNQARLDGALSISALLATHVFTIKNLNAQGGALAKVVDTGTANTVVNFSGGAAVRGIYKLLAVTDDVLTVSPAPPTEANGGALAVTIKGSMLRNPSVASAIVPPDFVIETGFEDISQYFVTDGQKVGGFSYDLTSNAILKGDFTFSGQATIRQGGTKLGDSDVYTPLATTATEVVNATVNVGTILVNGGQLSTALQSLTVTGDNALRDQNAVGHKFPAGIGAGRMDIKGQAKAYFADGSLWDKFINHDTVSLEWFIEDGQGHHYEWTVPAAKFDTDTVNPAAINQDVMEDLSYQAFRDPTTNCQLQIDRFSSIHPTTA